MIAVQFTNLEPLHGLLLSDPDVGLLQGDGPEAVVEEEQPLGGVDPQEGGHVLVVGQRGRQSHQPDHVLGCLDLADGAGHDGLKHGTPVVVKEVDLILGRKWRKWYIYPKIEW